MGRKHYLALVCVLGVIAAACSNSQSQEVGLDTDPAQSNKTESSAGATTVDDSGQTTVSVIAGGGDSTDAESSTTEAGTDSTEADSTTSEAAAAAKSQASAGKSKATSAAKPPVLSVPAAGGSDATAPSGQTKTKKNSSGTDATTAGTDKSNTTAGRTAGTQGTTAATGGSSATTRPATGATQGTTATTRGTTATTRGTTATTRGTSATTQAPTTQAPPAPLPVSTNSGPSPIGSLTFSEDFSSNSSMSRFDHHVYHRDDTINADRTTWLGDHQITGPNDTCGAPEEKRTINRGQRSAGFNDEWIYRCAPGGDAGKAHVMTSIGDTSGYSIGGLSPRQSFSNVREVRWEVNQTDLGARQFTEVAIIPTGTFNFDRLPCVDDLPCNTATHAELGSVGTHWNPLRARAIVTPQDTGGYLQAHGSPGYRCDSCPYNSAMHFGSDYGVGDAALTSIRLRRQNYFRDNGNGTLTWGFQLGDGSWDTFTAPGSFPNGSVRVVFKDHNYTPLKDPATLLPQTTFTWHWDNIRVYN